MSRHLHIVCLGSPYPADCGNSIDTFEKIRALRDSGIKIHLHLLKHKNGIDQELINYCETINSYSNYKKSINIDSLTNNLLENDFPILMEDIFIPNLLKSIRTGKRKIVIRVQTESFYQNEINKKSYPWLGLITRVGHKKCYSLPRDLLYACISENLAIALKQKKILEHTEFLPPFVTWQEVKCGTGMGSFCLYHGNLSDPANEKTAIWLLEKIFNKIRFPFVVAGKKPSRRISKLAHLYSHTCIVANPSKKEIDDLVQKAHINIVPSFQPGKVYKLLHSLFEGRHCLTNEMAVKNTNLAGACHIANDCQNKIEAIRYLITKPFLYKSN